MTAMVKGRARDMAKVLVNPQLDQEGWLRKSMEDDFRKGKNFL